MLYSIPSLCLTKAFEDVAQADAIEEPPAAEDLALEPIGVKKEGDVAIRGAKTNKGNGRRIP